MPRAPPRAPAAVGILPVAPSDPAPGDVWVVSGSQSGEPSEDEAGPAGPLAPDEVPEGGSGSPRSGPEVSQDE
eukprot:1194474-Alexandrium_andersonii.AAC.1